MENLTNPLTKIVTRSCINHVLEEYYSETTTSERREQLKRVCMGGRSGVIWSRFHGSQDFPNTVVDNQKVWEWLDDILSEGKFNTVHQMACSSARESAFYAR